MNPVFIKWHYYRAHAREVKRLAEIEENQKLMLMCFHPEIYKQIMAKEKEHLYGTKLFNETRDEEGRIVADMEYEDFKKIMEANKAELSKYELVEIQDDDTRSPFINTTPVAPMAVKRV